jgi:hypothetical protein
MVTDLTGQRFERLVVLERAENNKNNKCRGARWKCSCDCGATTVVPAGSLRSGHTKSCGCFQREQVRERHTKHGHSSGGARQDSPTYMSWIAMKSRCFNPNRKKYIEYGGRGITVCDRWKDSFANFLSDVGERPLGKTLDRYPNNDGNYEPSNTRWATSSEQMSNRRPWSKNKKIKAVHSVVTALQTSQLNNENHVSI